MLESNRTMQQKVGRLIRLVAILVPVIILVILLAQTVLAKTTYLISDGDTVLFHATYTTDPEQVLQEVGLSLNEQDRFSTQQGFGFSEITVHRLQTVTVKMGDKTLQTTSYGESVEELLDRLNITLTKEDILSETKSSSTYDGMVLSVSRAVKLEETYTVPVAYQTVYCHDPSLQEGEQRVLTAGVDGQMICIASVFYVDGMEVNRTILTETVVRQPVDALIAVGTYVPNPMPETQPEEEQPRPQRPEDTGKPIIGDGYILTPEGEMLTYTHSDQYVATAYTNTDPGCTIWTATGTLCRVGAIAVDPKVIPYGTRMYIVTNDGKYIYGICVAEDCGSSIKGNRVDLYFDTDPECWTFGIRDCTVYFLGE